VATPITAKPPGPQLFYAFRILAKQNHQLETRYPVSSDQGEPIPLVPFHFGIGTPSPGLRWGMYLFALVMIIRNLAAFGGAITGRSVLPGALREGGSPDKSRLICGFFDKFHFSENFVPQIPEK
jgi:hypothetical protein